MSIEEFYKKRENNQLNEAKETINEPKFINQMQLCDNFNKNERMLKMVNLYLLILMNL